MGQGNGKQDDLDIADMAFQVRNIWKKDISELPVAKDLPRLARKFRIYNTSGEISNFIVDDDDDSKNKVITEKISNAIFSIIVTLATDLDELVGKQGYGIGGMTFDVFEKEVNVLDHLSINGFLLRYFGENGKTISVLKACNQSIMAPAVTQIKKALLEKISYKDVSGGWMIHMNMNEHEVRVQHRKREQAVIKRNLKYVKLCEFEWEFSINFDRSDFSELKSISLKFLALEFDPECGLSDQEKKEIEKMLKGVISDMTIEFNSELFAKYQKKQQKKQKK